MYEDDEEIYDDTAEEKDMSIANKPVSALLSRFEQPAETPPKPTLNPKPGIKPKYGGGPGLKIASANDKKDVIGSNAFKPKGAINKPNEEEKEKDSPVGWQPKRRESEQSDADNKPKPAVKPGPKWQKSDTSNDTNNNATVNGVTSPKPDLPVGKKTPGKLNLESKFGGLNIPIPKQIGATGPSSGVVSPRNKTAETNIPKQDDKPGVGNKPEVGDKPVSPRNKPTKFGAQPGFSVLPKSSDTSGPIDFRGRLKPAAERRTSHDANSVNQESDSVQLRKTGSSKFGPRMSLKRVSITTVVRTSDGKKFQKTNKKSLDDDKSAPEKPAKVDFDIDIDLLTIDYKHALEGLDAADKESHGFTEVEEEEFYDDCGNLTETRQKSRVVSLMGSSGPKLLPRKPLRKVPPIPTMTEEEEAEWNDNGFPGLPDESLPAPPVEMLQEEYDDVGIAPPVSQTNNDDGELYEPLSDLEDELPPPPGPKPSNEPPAVPTTPLPTSGDKTSAEKAKDAKELEKERKRKEKEEKELLKKKEKELKKLTKLLKVTPDILTKTVGKGKVKANAKGKEKSGELALTSGEEVDIIRMVDNPRGKWLVRVLSTEKASDNGPYSPMELIGYCDENNIEFMKGSGPEKKASVSAAPVEEQETYEDVDGNGGDDPIADEIYEECN